MIVVHNRSDHCHQCSGLNDKDNILEFQFTYFIIGKSKDEAAPKKRKTTSSAGCPYYKQDPIEDFKDQALVEVRDIEQLIGLGRQLKACPYYGTRLAIPDAEVRD